MEDKLRTTFCKTLADPLGILKNYLKSLKANKKTNLFYDHLYYVLITNYILFITSFGFNIIPNYLQQSCQIF